MLHLQPPPVISAVRVDFCSLMKQKSTLQTSMPVVMSGVIGDPSIGGLDFWAVKILVKTLDAGHGAAW